jgi:hypothetical protein
VIERQVMQCRRTAGGRVSALVNRGEEWSPRSAEDAARDIRSGRIRYVIPWASGDAPVVTDGAALLEADGPDGCPGGLLALPSG